MCGSCGAASAATEAAPHEPHIQILKGEPTVEEVAAPPTHPSTVTSAATSSTVGSPLRIWMCGSCGAPEPEQPEKTRWGLPVDRLRFAMSNYQRLTMQQMTHLRR
ncbi:hypothetical protein MAHJHV57_50120 [Mycobacterium avium subsp. hominissuis]